MTKKRTKPLVKEVFTDKPEPEAEIWTAKQLADYLGNYQQNYVGGDNFYKAWAWKDVNTLIDQVLSGQIIVEKPLDNEQELM